MTLLNQTEPTFTKKFTLTLTVEGTRLQDIDDGLVEAAGERLKARMTNPPSNLTFREAVRPGNDSASAGAVHASTSTVVRDINPPATEKVFDDVGNHTVVEGPKKRGRKPGQKVGPYKKQEEEKNEEIHDEENDENHDAPEKAQDDPKEIREPHVRVSAGKPATAEDAVAALKLVNSTHNVDRARAALEKFNVKRCGELTDDNRQKFIDYCQEICQ